MPQQMTLEQLDELLTSLIVKAQGSSKELEEVQVQFVSQHETSKSAHDATLGDLTRRALERLDSLPSALRQTILERVEVERSTLDERRQALRERLIPEAEKSADDLLAQAQSQSAELRALNPKLDQQEEALKAARAQMEAGLTQLNAQIKARSGCLVAIFNFFKILELDRQRHKLLGQMEGNATALRKVRDEWAAARQQFETKESDLQAQWQQASLQVTRAREELAQLDDDRQRDPLAWKRAAFYVFDNWVTPMPPESSPWGEEINRMAQLNLQTDAYQEGLGKVAGLIALLRGLVSSFTSLEASVQALINEQRMHSSYLKPLKVALDDQVMAFARAWDQFGARIKDEVTLGENPGQFSLLFEAETSGFLSEANLKRFFSSIGQSLDEATRGWRG